MINKVIPMPLDKYKILISLGELLGISAEDIVNIINVKPLIEQVENLEIKIANLEEKISILTANNNALVEYITTKENNKFTEEYQDLVNALTKQGDDDEE